MSIKPLSYHGFSLDFLIAGSNREKEGKRPGDTTACMCVCSGVMSVNQVSVCVCVCVSVCVRLSRHVTSVRGSDFSVCRSVVPFVCHWAVRMWIWPMSKTKRKEGVKWGRQDKRPGGRNQKEGRQKTRLPPTSRQWRRPVALLARGRSSAPFRRNEGERGNIQKKLTDQSNLMRISPVRK